MLPSPVRKTASLLAYLSRYTHSATNSNRRLIALEEDGVTLRKDYRHVEANRQRVMTLSANLFIRGFCFTSFPAALPEYLPILSLFQAL